VDHYQGTNPTLAQASLAIRETFSKRPRYVRMVAQFFTGACQFIHNLSDSGTLYHQLAMVK
jgi:hypothetical protein